MSFEAEAIAAAALADAEADFSAAKQIYESTISALEAKVAAFNAPPAPTPPAAEPPASDAQAD